MKPFDAIKASAYDSRSPAWHCRCPDLHALQFGCSHDAGCNLAYLNSNQRPYGLASKCLHVYVLTGGAAAMKASGYAPKMIRSRAPKEPNVSAADAEAIWSEDNSTSSSPATPPQDLAQSAPEASSSRAAADIAQEQGEATRSYGMYRPLGTTSSPPGSTSQSGRPSEAGSTGTRQPYWRRQYIFCAATMPSGSGDKKDKSISKVCHRSTPMGNSWVSQ